MTTAVNIRDTENLKIVAVGVKRRGKILERFKMWLHQLITNVRDEGKGVQDDTKASSLDLHRGEGTVYIVKNPSVLKLILVLILYLIFIIL